mmetsp:Transcript_4350/g.6885  ORF Transcript_4350/g.6885 Transcript_4350/m.6885 type:complete len:234 (-) Transcript_4350:341-1042(-)
MLSAGGEELAPPHMASSLAKASASLSLSFSCLRFSMRSSIAELLMSSPPTTLGFSFFSAFGFLASLISLTSLASFFSFFSLAGSAALGLAGAEVSKNESRSPPESMGPRSIKFSTTGVGLAFTGLATFLGAGLGAGSSSDSDSVSDSVSDSEVSAFFLALDFFLDPAIWLSTFSLSCLRHFSAAFELHRSLRGKSYASFSFRKSLQGLFPPFCMKASCLSSHLSIVTLLTKLR